MSLFVAVLLAKEMDELHWRELQMLAYHNEKTAFTLGAEQGAPHMLATSA